MLRVVGAAVLLWLGFTAWRTAWLTRHGAGAPVGEEVPVDPRRWWRRAFGEGLIVQLANPKAAVFMIAFDP